MAMCDKGENEGIFFQTGAIALRIARWIFLPFVIKQIPSKGTPA